MVTAAPVGERRSAMEPVVREAVAEQLERLAALDAVAAPLQQAVRRAVPQGTALKDVLSGTWLGHPLHPPLTDVVVGSWTSALLLDLLGGESSGPAADRLVAAGAAAAVPTAAAGLSDWAELRDGTRRIGTVHALGNTTALILQTSSLLQRRRGNRRRGVALSALAFGIASFSAWLGGHLSFARGVGVNQTAFEDPPTEWTRVADEAELADGTLRAAHAGDLPVLLVRSGGRIHALADRCSHRGCALHEGELRDDTVICPCHGSTFRLDGSIVRGPATSPQPRLDVRTADGTIEIRRPTPER